jgi:hypothetical protein
MSNKSVGRPLRFKSARTLKKKIEAYFNDCLPHPEQYTAYEYQKKTVTRRVRDNATHKMIEKDFEVDDNSKEPQPVTAWRVSSPITPTVTGLAVFLGTSRQTLLEYEGEVEGREKSTEFADTIKAAKDLIELHWEQMLIGSNVTGVIFNLKNNYHWTDKSEQEITNPDGSLNPYSRLSEEELRKLAGQ